MRASGFSISAPRSIVNISSWMSCMTGTFHGKESCTFVQLGFGLLAVGKCWDTHIQFLNVSDNVFPACAIYKVMKPCTPHRSPAQCTDLCMNVGDIETDEARLPTCLILFCSDLLEECLWEDVIF